MGKDLKISLLMRLEEVAGKMRHRILFDPEMSALYKTARDLLKDAADTGMRLYQGEDWNVTADWRLDPDDEDRILTPNRAAVAHGEFQVPCARLRRVGWLDQKGRVYTDEIPRDFDGGSLTPLLIDAREN